MPDDATAIPAFGHWPAHPPPVAVRLPVMPDHACPYFAGRVATYRGGHADALPPDLYQQFMDANFRRSGKVLYQPVCRGCRLCVQVRVPTDRFAPSKSQRRCARRNADVVVTVGVPDLTGEKFDLYHRYAVGWHGDAPADPTPDTLRRFLYDSPVDTLEFSYRLGPGGPLLAVGIGDVSAGALSSVYFYFDPAHAARGLGTFGAVYEIAWARARSIPFYYLGYWVNGSPTMHYKVSYRPAQLLGPDGAWRDAPPAGG